MNRFDAALFNRCFVDARSIEIADLLIDCIALAARRPSLL